MERQVNPQLDLFSDSDANPASGANRNNPFLVRIWNYEKTILILIGLLITGIICFSLGVERGKQAVLAKQSAALEAARLQGSSRPAPLATPPQVIISKEEAVRQAMPVMQQQGGVFTIQVASFKSRTSAQKEAEVLKRKGFPTSILSKGGYVVLCVGSFPNKEAAQPLLPELNKRYGSCSIRRL